MNNVFTAKLLQNLNNKKGEKGFTLIELLVVVIIIGVLAAVALPNLLGQVGKARESEAKSALGALNRAQQGYHLEARAFYDAGATNGTDTWTDTETALGVVPGKEFYVYTNNTAAPAGTPPVPAANSTLRAVAVNPDNDGARDFAAGMNYNAGAFSSVLCVATNKATGTGRVADTGTTAATAVAVPAAGGGSCTGGNVIE